MKLKIGDTVYLSNGWTNEKENPFIKGDVVGFFGKDKWVRVKINNSESVMTIPPNCINLTPNYNHE